MNEQELRDTISRLGPWHHDVEVAPGVRTGDPALRGEYSPELGTPTVFQPEQYIAGIVDQVFPGGLAGRSFLDCACNAGGYLFAAARLGAGRCFGFDVRDHWITQAKFLAEHVPSENIEFDTFDLATLPKRGLGTFDVTIFNGIFYHLPDPVAGLRVAADQTRELLVVNTATCPSPGDALVLNYESVTEVMSGVHNLAWLPSNDTVVRAALAWCGFPHSRLRYENRTVVETWRRIDVIAAREEKTLAAYDDWRAQQPPPRQVSANARPQPRRRRGWVKRLLRRK